MIELTFLNFVFSLSDLSHEFVSESQDLFNLLCWTFLHKYVVT